MILRTPPGFSCPLPTTILNINTDQVGLLFQQDFVLAKVKGLILWKWVLCTVIRTTTDLTQQHDQITTS